MPIISNRNIHVHVDEDAWQGVVSPEPLYLATTLEQRPAPRPQHLWSSFRLKNMFLSDDLDDGASDDNMPLPVN